MVGKKSGRSLMRDEGTPVNARAALRRSARREHHCFCMLTSAMWPSGLERTDNNLDLTTWPQVSMINQKNYYTSVFPRFLSTVPRPPTHNSVVFSYNLAGFGVKSGSELGHHGTGPRGHPSTDSQSRRDRGVSSTGPSVKALRLLAPESSSIRWPHTFLRPPPHYTLLALSLRTKEPCLDLGPQERTSQNILENTALWHTISEGVLSKNKHDCALSRARSKQAEGILQGIGPGSLMQAAPAETLLHLLSSHTKEYLCSGCGQLCPRHLCGQQQFFFLAMSPPLLNPTGPRACNSNQCHEPNTPQSFRQPIRQSTLLRLQEQYHEIPGCSRPRMFSTLCFLRNRPVHSSFRLK